MIKIVGCIMIFVSCLAFGLRIKKTKSKRAEDLENLCSCMHMLEKEISYSLSDMETAFKNMLEISDGINKKIFTDICHSLENHNGRPMSEIWNNLIDQNQAIGFYLKEDINVIKQFGNVLGSGDVETQLKNIEIFKNNLKEKIEEAKGIAEKNGDLSLKIGVYAGVLIVIFVL